MVSKARLNQWRWPEAGTDGEDITRRASGWNPCLLVVDDDPSVQELLQEVLSGAGYRVDAAFDSEEAMEKVTSGHHDGLILDMVLPEEDGLRLYEKIVEVRPMLHNRVTFISGLAREHQTRRVAKATGESLLRKPFNILELLEILHRQGL